MTNSDVISEPLYRIVLVEDDEQLLNRLVRIIDRWSGGELIAACSNVVNATTVILEQAVDLIITDLNLPDGNGIEIIRLLRKQQPAAEAIVFSVLADDRSVIEAIEAGATGYLLKDSDPIDIIDSINALREGRSPISSQIARTLVRRLSGRANLPSEKNPKDTGLTPREMEILSGIAKGLTYNELAERLEISKQTVPVHIKNIYRKLHASNKAEAVYVASMRGLLKL